MHVLEPLLLMKTWCASQCVPLLPYLTSSPAESSACSRVMYTCLLVWTPPTPHPTNPTRPPYLPTHPWHTLSHTYPPHTPTPIHSPPCR